MLTKTKDRVGAAVVAVAAVVGLVLVFAQPKEAGGDDDKPGTSQVQQGPGQDDDDAPAPGQAPVQAPSGSDQDQDDVPAPGQAPAPAAPGQQPPAGGDTDGDGDG